MMMDGVITKIGFSKKIIATLDITQNRIHYYYYMQHWSLENVVAEFLD
jgi:hypothetical protein